MKYLNFSAPINDLSYGIVGYNVFKRIINYIDKLYFWPIEPTYIAASIYPDIVNDLNQCVNRVPCSESVNAPHLVIFHQNMLLGRMASRWGWIGFPIFELDAFDEISTGHIKSMDKIFVTCEWAKNIVESVGVSPDNVNVINLGVDTDIFKPSKASSDDTVRFLNIGKFEVRKGHDILPMMFKQAFPNNEDVELIMMCDNPFMKDKSYLNSILSVDKRIKVVNRVKNQSEISNLINVCDCGVFPSRAEGWNMPLLEMMACGKHVIVSNYSAHTEYCNSDNSILIDVDGLEKANDGIWFHGEGNWAKLGGNFMKSFVDAMRHIYELKRSGRLGLNMAGVETASKLTWNRTVMEIVNNAK